jgi:hypothetical protein
MTQLPHPTRLRSLLGAAVAAACVGACSLNPQPLPPGEYDGAAALPAQGGADAGKNDLDTDAGAGGGEGGAGAEGGFGEAGFPEGGEAGFEEAGLEDVSGDVTPEAAPEAGSHDAHASDAGVD